MTSSSSNSTELILKTLKKWSLCPLGIHNSKLPDGRHANFCGICGVHLVDDAYFFYDVHLRDGACYTVSAVNVHHAKKMVCCGSAGAFLIHPNNIVRIIPNLNVAILDHSGDPYQFNAIGKIECPPAYIKLGGKLVAALDLMSIEGDTLKVLHFGVVEQHIGKGFGEPVLRAFAKLMVAQNVKVSKVDFQLVSMPESVDQNILRSARVRLLERIGATEIACIAGNDDGNPVVHAIWDRSMWA